MRHCHVSRHTHREAHQAHLWANPTHSFARELRPQRSYEMGRYTCTTNNNVPLCKQRHHTCLCGAFGWGDGGRAARATPPWLPSKAASAASTSICSCSRLKRPPQTLGKSMPARTHWRKYQPPLTPTSTAHTKSVQRAAGSAAAAVNGGSSGAAMLLSTHSVKQDSSVNTHTVQKLGLAWL